MNPILKNILAVIAGVVIGSIVNILLVNLGPLVIPAPADADITSMEGLKETMHLFQPKHFIFPFLAHALGTLVGAFIAAMIATSKKMWFAIAIGVFFLAGGIMNVAMLPSPTWFAVLDIVGAYLPMGWLGGKWAMQQTSASAA